MIRPLVAAAAADAPALVVCPFAGGSAGAFRRWRALADPRMDISIATYSGRDHRSGERCADTIEALAEELSTELTRRPGRSSLILAGHSMGAQVAFETCRYLEEAGRPPALLVLSGCHAPHHHGRRRLSHLDDRGFIEALIAIGGCDPMLRDEPALLDLFLPMLRSDFRATETYRRVPPAPCLATGTLLVCGRDDAEASAEEVSAWNEWLAAPPQVPTMLDGDHFYPTRTPERFLEVIAHRIPNPDNQRPNRYPS